MNLYYDGQLITTSLTVIFRGEALKIDDVIVDTGSSHTVISPFTTLLFCVMLK